MRPLLLALVPLALVLAGCTDPEESGGDGAPTSGDGSGEVRGELDVVGNDTGDDNLTLDNSSDDNSTFDNSTNTTAGP